MWNTLSVEVQPLSGFSTTNLSTGSWPLVWRHPRRISVCVCSVRWRRDSDHFVRKVFTVSFRQHLSFYLFFKIFGGHESFLWGHWYPCFGLLVTSPLCFKARVSSALFTLGGVIRVTLHIPWDSPLVLHLLTSWQLTWLLSRFLPHTCKCIGGSQTGDLLLHERMLNRLCYAGSFYLSLSLFLSHRWICLCVFPFSKDHIFVSFLRKTAYSSQRYSAKRYDEIW